MTHCGLWRFFFFFFSTWLLLRRKSGEPTKKRKGGRIIWQKNDRNSHNQALKRAKLLPSPTGYMLTSSPYSLSIWGIFHKKIGIFSWSLWTSTGSSVTSSEFSLFIAACHLPCSSLLLMGNCSRPPSRPSLLTLHNYRSPYTWAHSCCTTTVLHYERTWWCWKTLPFWHWR